MKKLILVLASLMAVNAFAFDNDHTFASVNIADVSGDLRGQLVSVGVSVDVMDHVALLAAWSHGKFDSTIVEENSVESEDRNVGVLVFHDFGLETGTKFEAVLMFGRSVGAETYQGVYMPGSRSTKHLGLGVIQEVGDMVELKFQVAQSYIGLGFDDGTTLYAPEISVKFSELLTVSAAYNFNSNKRNEAISVGWDFAF